MRVSRAFPGISCVMAAVHSVVLASFVAHVKGVMFYDHCVSGAVWGDSVHLVRAPGSLYDSNCIDVMCVRCTHYKLGHLAAPVASFLSPLMRDSPVTVSG